MRRSHFALAAALAAFSACTHPGSSGDDTASRNAPHSRRLAFSYEATLKEAPAGASELQVWVPAPQNIADLQQVESENLVVVNRPDARVQLVTPPGGANRWWHVSIPSPRSGDKLVASIEVTRHEQRSPSFRGAGRQALTNEERAALASELGPYELVPVGGRMGEIAASVASDEKNQLNIARRYYNYVLERMRYSKDGTGWGRGDTLWACDSGFGNCTDFHSMFMSLTKSQGIPARFHMGFPIPETRGEGKVGGYHCWAEFYLAGTGWVPVDISEADKYPDLAEYYFGNLTEDRIAFVTGRDLDLTPRPAAGRLNFLIYPHAELDGKTITLERAFSYRDA